MSRSNWILAPALVFTLLAPTAHSGKPQPPLLPPRIVAVFGALAVDTRGDIYTALTLSVQCATGTLTVQPLGNIFGGSAPPSPVVDIDALNGVYVVILENGDVYGWCDLQRTGVLTGNIFTAAAASRTSDFAPIDPTPSSEAPDAPEDDAPSTVRPGAVR